MQVKCVFIEFNFIRLNSSESYFRKFSVRSNFKFRTKLDASKQEEKANQHQGGLVMKSLFVKGLSLILLTAAIAPTALAASVETNNEVTAKETQTELRKARQEREWYDRESRRFREEPHALKGKDEDRAWYERESHRFHEEADAFKRRQKREWYERESHRFHEETDALKHKDKDREWYERESHR
jgi:hypothetical protein